jgi:magnesium transporter
MRWAHRSPTSGSTAVPDERDHHDVAGDHDADEAVGDCAVYEDGQRRPGRIPLRQAGEEARRTSGFVWIGLQQPSDADIEEVAARFELPALAVEDAVKAHQRPKLEVYGDVVFVVLKPVRYVDHDEVVDIAELAIFLGPGFVVTVRHGRSDVLGRVRHEVDSRTFELVGAFGAASVLYRVADLVVDEYEATLDLINDDIDDIEALVFGAGDQDHSERIYKLKREISEFRRSVLPLARPLQRLAAGQVPGVPQLSEAYFRDVEDHLLRAAEVLEGIDSRLSDVLQANTARVTVAQSAIALRQNEDVRKISAWAAIALVPTAIAGIYGMNFENMPELTWRYGYFLVLAVIAGACLVLHRLFKRNGWL